MKLYVRNNSAAGGLIEGEFEVGDKECAIRWNSPIIKAFLEDDDIQELSIASANMVFTNTLTKLYQPRVRECSTSQ